MKNNTLFSLLDCLLHPLKNLIANDRTGDLNQILVGYLHMFF